MVDVVNEDGTEIEPGPGSGYIVEPGRDARVVGDDPMTGSEPTASWRK